MEPLKMKKGNIIVYLSLLAVAIASMIYTHALSSRNDEVDAEDSGALKVGIQISPIGVSMTPADTLGGFYYDMIRSIADSENLKLKIEGFAQISSALDSLEAGRFDLVVADIPSTTGMQSRFLLTDPIYADREVLVQLRDSLTGKAPYESVSQLRGASIHLPAGSPMIQRISNLSHELGDTIYVTLDPEYGAEQMVILTALGEIPNVVVNEQLARRMAADYPQLDTSITVSFNQFQSWAVSDDNQPLLDSINAYISRFKQTKQFRNLVDKYFDKIPAKILAE